MDTNEEYWEMVSDEYARVQKQQNELVRDQLGDDEWVEINEPLRGSAEYTLMRYQGVDSITCARALALPLTMDIHWDPGKESFEEYVAALIRSVDDYSW